MHKDIFAAALRLNESVVLRPTSQCLYSYLPTLELAKAPARLRSAEALTFLTVSCAAVRFGQRGRRLQRAGNPNNDRATTATQAPVDSGKTQLAAEAIAETASAVSTILQLLNMRSEWQSPRSGFKFKVWGAIFAAYAAALPSPSAHLHPEAGKSFTRFHGRNLGIEPSVLC